MDVKIDIEKLEKACKENISKYLAYKQYYGRRCGTTYYINKFVNLVKEYNIDTSHWTGKRGEKRYKEYTYLNELVFCETCAASSILLTRRIKKENLMSYECTICGNTGTWQNSPLTLHLDHINGNKKDSRLENLRYLCPNCHQQTDTWGMKNSKRKFPELSVLYEEAKHMTYMQMAEKYDTHYTYIAKMIKDYTNANKSNLPKRHSQ